MTIKELVEKYFRRKLPNEIRQIHMNALEELPHNFYKRYMMRVSIEYDNEYLGTCEWVVTVYPSDIAESKFVILAQELHELF